MHACSVRRIPQLLALTGLVALIPASAAESQQDSVIQLCELTGECGDLGRPKPKASAKPGPKPAANKNTNANSDPGGGTRYYGGPAAQAILDARKAGSRHMVVLNRSWDASRNCYVEERAWVGGMRASDGGTVAVTVGPSRAVCVTKTTLTAPQVNKFEAHLATARNELAKWLNYQQQLPAQFNGHNATHARNEYARATERITYYEGYITRVQARIAAGAP